MAQSQETVGGGPDETDVFIDSAKRGYGRVGSGIKNYFVGLWLQISRLLVFWVWVGAALLVWAGVMAVSESVAVLAFFATFVSLPIVWGYYERSKDE